MTTALYTHPLCKLHKLDDSHPECPERIDAIEAALKSRRIAPHLDQRLAPEAPLEAIRRIHLADTIQQVRDHTPTEDDQYYGIGEISINRHSWDAALRAAGAGIAAVDALMAGEIDNAFCLVRPIGHHATPGTPMGFCLFNNVAIAAAHALKVHGLERVAVIDTDVHHGNGTEEIFINEPRVLMCSYYQTYLYPFCGNERPRAHMVNVPVPAGTDGTRIRQIVTERWLPALRAHQPQMIFFSAGFDALRSDPLGDMNLSEGDYVWITQQVMALADDCAQGRIVSFLEGGYNLQALAGAAAAHIKTLARLD